MKNNLGIVKKYYFQMLDSKQKYDREKPIQEKIDTDGSSIYLTTKETLFVHHHLKVKVITGEITQTKLF